jgi:uncharacterized protein
MVDFNCQLVFVCLCVGMVMTDSGVTKNLKISKVQSFSGKMKKMNKQKESKKESTLQQQRQVQGLELHHSYREEEVSYENQEAGITLSGTLTLPLNQEQAPVVLLVPGMGPADRNATSMGGHHLFFVIAGYLAQRGIAVLRFDKRGIGKSTGHYDWTVTSQDFAKDVLAGVEYLKTRQEINKKQIGLIGYSEGGMIASLVASWTSDVSFIVSMAGVSLTDVETILQQMALQLRADGASEEFIMRDRHLREELVEVMQQELSHDQAEKKMFEIFEHYWVELPESCKREPENLTFAYTRNNGRARIKMFNSPWYRFFLGYNPVATLKKITIPVLAINGDHDWIVLGDKSLAAFDQALAQAGNNDYTTRLFPQLNHQFQTCETGSLMEYGLIKEAIAPEVLELMAEWILKRTVKKECK